MPVPITTVRQATQEEEDENISVDEHAVFVIPAPTPPQGPAFHCVWCKVWLRGSYWDHQLDPWHLHCADTLHCESCLRVMRACRFPTREGRYEMRYRGDRDLQGLRCFECELEHHRLYFRVRFGMLARELHNVFEPVRSLRLSTCWEEYCQHPGC